MNHQTTIDFTATEQARLQKQTEAVLKVMRDGRWRTYDQIQAEMEVYAGTPSISARLRQLRNELGYTVDRRRTGNRGLYEYRVTGACRHESCDQ